MPRDATRLATFSWATPHTPQHTLFAMSTRPPIAKIIHYIRFVMSSRLSTRPLQNLFTNSGLPVRITDHPSRTKRSEMLANASLTTVAYKINDVPRDAQLCTAAQAANTKTQLARTVNKQITKNIHNCLARSAAQRRTSCQNTTQLARSVHTPIARIIQTQNWLFALANS